MRTWPTCAGPAGTSSPGNGCATGPPTPPPRWPGPGATSRCATTCGSRRWSPPKAPRASGGSSATTPTRPAKDKAHRDDAIARVSAELDRIAGARAKTKQAKTKHATTTAGKSAAKTTAAARRKSDAEEAAHLKAECALRDHPALGRWLRQTSTGRLVLDRKKIAAEERLDGKYLLSTSDPHLSAEDAALGYKNLLEAERGFRDLNSTLELRPVFHRLEPRIRAHVLLCWLALLLIRVAERRTGLTWRRVALELGRLHAVTLQGTTGTVTQTTEPTDTQLGILRACGIPTPPRITTLNPT